VRAITCLLKPYMQQTNALAEMAGLTEATSSYNFLAWYEGNHGAAYLRECEPASKSSSLQYSGAIPVDAVIELNGRKRSSVATITG
jgi:hypothetical protein